MKAKFSQKVKEQIAERDWSCIICWSPWSSAHHIYFWLEANRTEARNNIDQWVILCLEHHKIAHWCKSGEWIRQKCIEYLKNYYG